MSTYRINIKGNHSILLQYDPDTDLLKKVEFETEFNYEQTEWALSLIATSSMALDYIGQKFSKVIKIEQVQEKPPTFEVFWEKYAYKVSRQNAEKEWSKLKPADQAKAFRQITKYDNWLRLQVPSPAKLYAERYLKHRRFDDDFNTSK